MTHLITLLEKREKKKKQENTKALTTNFKYKMHKTKYFYIYIILFKQKNTIQNVPPHSHTANKLNLIPQSWPILIVLANYSGFIQI